MQSDNVVRMPAFKHKIVARPLLPPSFFMSTLALTPALYGTYSQQYLIQIQDRTDINTDYCVIAWGTLAQLTYKCTPS